MGVEGTDMSIDNPQGERMVMGEQSRASHLPSGKGKDGIFHYHWFHPHLSSLPSSTDGSASAVSLPFNSSLTAHAAQSV